MIRLARPFAAACFLALSLFSSGAQNPETERFPTLTPEAVRRHVYYLASDALGGRGTPSEGLDLAAEYISKAFKGIGLLPLDDGTYFQTARGMTVRTRSGAVQADLHNVIGWIEGSDPVLKHEYVIVSAHYDHLGTFGEGEDPIYNGANDDASGVSGMIEVARALVAHSPRRSIVFIAFFGEERGLLGSRYYAEHPVFPLKQTVAMLNLEQIGRSDSTEGSQVRRVSLTGFDYSTVGSVLVEVAKEFGVEAYRHPRNSDAYFSRSDNAALANVGIPAHTLTVAFQYSDYHGVDDEPEKLDYENMALTCKVAAGTILRVANEDQRPGWNPDVPAARRYWEKWKELVGIQLRPTDF
ncbi:MAG: peptidase M28 [Fimbriimonadales bacterium]|nr:MAG: peptidase M28 [Fimbriimonadales bacterium]